MKKIFSFQIYQLLSFAGTIPYVGSAIFMSLGVSNIGLGVSINEMVASYSLAIISFMAGTVWANALKFQGLYSHALMVLSNSLLLICWFFFLWGEHNHVLLVSIICFIALLMMDLDLYRKDQFEATYFRTRVFVSIVVIISLVICSGVRLSEN